MKRLIKLVSFIGIVVAVFGIISCNSPWFDPIEKSKSHEEGIPGIIKDCDLVGTMIRVSCGTSIYDNLWIRTDNGKLIRPCQQSFRPICPIILKAGDRVKFSYRNLTEGSSCSDSYGCGMITPIHQKAVIDCITLCNGRNPSDTLPGQLTMSTPPKDLGIEVLDAVVAGTELTLMIRYEGCAEYDNGDFKLIWDGEVTNEEPGRANLWITHLRSDNCGSYYKKRLKFDIKQLHDKFSGPILVNIKDKQIKFQ